MQVETENVYDLDTARELGLRDELLGPTGDYSLQYIAGTRESSRKLKFSSFSLLMIHGSLLFCILLGL